MSLINDALKQAREAQPNDGSPASGPAMRPVEPGRRPADGQGFLLPSLIVAALLVGGVSLWQGAGSGGGAVKVRANSPTETVQPAAPVAESQPARIPTPASKVEPAPATATSAGTNTPASVIEPATNIAAAVETKPQSPVYRLQGIFYLPNNPSAVINGKTVYPGSRVGDATVVAITQNSATIVTASGQTNILEVAERVR